MAWENSDEVELSPLEKTFREVSEKEAAEFSPATIQHLKTILAATEKKGRRSSLGLVFMHAGTLEFDGSQIVFRPEPPLPDEKIAAIGEDFAEDLNEGAPMSDFSGRPIPLEDLGSISAETWDRLGDVLASYSQGALTLLPRGS